MIAWRLERFEALPSTSDFCLLRAKAGEPEGLAVFCARQTAGRGSRGRSWESGVGNVALSVLLRPAITPAQSGMFPLLAGVAVVQAIGEALPAGVKAMLKWPNDVLIEGAKCAGLLVDAAPLGNRVDWLVIGMGINVAFAPVVAGRAVTCLAAHGATVTAEELAGAVLARLAEALEIHQQYGLGLTIERWMAHAHPVGSEMAVKLGETAVRGRFEGLSAGGELMLRVAERIESFSTGEILLGWKEK